MNKALKITDTEENSVELNSRDNAQLGSLTNLDAEAIRAKIKAARLEKLMARQLENELSIELDTEIEVSEQQDMMLRWQNGAISNYDYLMYLNRFVLALCYLKKMLQIYW